MGVAKIPPRTTHTSKRAGVESGLSSERDLIKSRQWKSAQVEKQLSKAAHTTSEMSKDKQSEIVPPKGATAEKTTFVMTEKRMIAPTSKDAPRFKSSKPEDLRRFLTSMEDLWEAANITLDRAKKNMVGKYADHESEEEWKAFDTFEDGHTWDEFKEELLENYPEAAAAERGTPARIRKLCYDVGKIELGDMKTLFTFRRSFGAEAKKLQKPPVAMANRELVELFIGCLTDNFALAVLQHLGNKPADPQPVATSGQSTQGQSTVSSGNVVPKRPEDKYDIKDVCEAALNVSENSQGMYNLMNKASTERRGALLFTQPVHESTAWSEKLNELEGEQALEKDRLVSLGKTLDARMGGLEDLIKSLMKHNQENDTQGVSKGDEKGGSYKMHDANSSPAQKWGAKSYENEKCFWCGLFGHFQVDCEDLKHQIKVGNVKINPEGKLRLKDGSYIPRQPLEASLKERMERHYSRRPSQFFYGEYDDVDPPSSVAPSVLSQIMGSSNDADKRTIAQLKAELDLRKREEALDYRQKMLGQNDKMVEQTSSAVRTANALELLGQLSDEELAAIKAAKSSFH